MLDTVLGILLLPHLKYSLIRVIPLKKDLLGEMQISDIKMQKQLDLVLEPNL
jgi:hypothetical protein